MIFTLFLSGGRRIKITDRISIEVQVAQLNEKIIYTAW
jgi:hypothetical protein